MAVPVCRVAADIVEASDAPIPDVVRRVAQELAKRACNRHAARDQHGKKVCVPVRVGGSVSVASRLTVDCSVRALFIDSSVLFFLQLPAVQVEAAGQDRGAGGQPEVRKCVCPR